MNDSISKSSFQFEGFIYTPHLWKSELFGFKPFLLPQINFDSPLNPDHLLPDLQLNHVLGKRAEVFFKLAMNFSSEYVVIASNVQITREKITIGELDFLLKNIKTDRIFHVEMVYKYYVYDPSFTEEMQRWIGPNRRDSLLKKLDRLKNHQVPLLHKEETCAALQSLGIDAQNVEQRVYFPANLFVPKQLLRSSFPYINNNCVAGYWIHRKDFTHEDYSTSYYYTPKKQDWPILPQLNSTWFPYEEIQDQVDELLYRKKAPLIWMKTAEGNFERFFIVWW